MTEQKFSFARDKDKIQELRKMSKNQFPMMHCAKALSQTNGNLDEAFIWMQQHPGFYS
jgi:translation elongation factor EF-Ts